MGFGGISNAYRRAGAGLAAGLLAVLAAYAATSAPRSAAGNVDASTVLADTVSGKDWLVNGRDFGSAHFSPLNLINDANVKDLGLAWSLDIDSPMGLPTEPIVVDGTIYIPATLDRVFAIDASSGRQIWSYDPHVALGATMMGSYASRINRGVAVWQHRVFIGTGDCRVIALDAGTGAQLWQTTVCTASETGITGAPRVGGGKVYIGYFGSDTGTRGSMVALDADSGKIAWRFWNVPGDPSKGFENKALEMAAKTWNGKDWWKAGGGASWDPIVYDQSTGLLIYGTAGPGDGLGGAIATSGDRLFSDCIIALRADTGEYVWHYQTGRLANPNSEAHGHRSPESFHIVLTDIHDERREAPRGDDGASIRRICRPRCQNG